MTVDPNFIFSLAGFMTSAGAVLVGVGIVINRVRNLEKRTDEDRAHNAGQHRDFYAARDSQGERIGVIEALISAMEKDVAEIKSDVKNGFRKIREELGQMGRSE